MPWPLAGSASMAAGKFNTRPLARMPNQDASVPAASSVRLSGAPANTIGRLRLRPSRASKKGSGSSARSLACGAESVTNSSTLALLMVAHRLECSGSSHPVV